MFNWLEKNPFFFTVTFLLVMSIGSVVSNIPSFAKVARPIEGLKPYSVLEIAGRHIYIKENCSGCHSQLIRPFKIEVDRYGPYSLSGEYAYDRPFLWGSKRTGPDLHRIGDKRDARWHEAHFTNPALIVPGSIMPMYPHIFTKNADFATAYADAYTQKVVFGTPYDVEGYIKLGSKDEAKVAYLAEATLVAEQMLSKELQDNVKNGEVNEVVALIAYLNSLGQNRRLVKQNGL